MIKLKNLLIEDITKTPEFKRWFGNSKVVDKGGNPLIVYHRTDKEFNAFDTSIQRRNFNILGLGAYFTVDRDMASKYADGENSRVIPVYLRIENPASMNDLQKAKDLGGDAKNTTKELKKMGYDGVIHEASGEIVVFLRHK
jgi:hypothetical protein